MSATFAVVTLLVLASADGVERRRPLYRRTSTTTASPAADDSEGSESKYKPNGKDLYTVSDSYPVSGAGGFKPDGDKLTVGIPLRVLCSISRVLLTCVWCFVCILQSFSEYSFGSTKLSGGPDGGGLADGGGGIASDEESTFGGFKNHKKGSPLLPTTNANTKERKPTANSPFDFLNGDYAKPKVQSDTTGLGGLSSASGKSKLPSSISSKFSISHPTPSTLGSGSKAAGKLAHLDDSTEYDVYSSLGQSVSAAAAGKSKLGKHRQPLTATSYSSSGGFEGKVKKVPFKYEDGGLGALAGKTKTKSKLSLDDDTSHFASASSPFPGLGSYESASSFVGKQQQHQLGSNSGLGSSAGAGHKGSKFNFAEPPPLVKSTLNTLKHFGEGLIGNGNGAGRSPYELESEESGSYPAQGVKFGSYFGKGHFGGNVAGSSSSGSNGPAVEESYETSGEPLQKGSKFSKPLGLGGLGGKFATDFDVKNIKLTDGGGAFGVGVGAGIGHKLPGKNTPPHHGKHGPTLHHSQPAPVQPLHSHSHNSHNHNSHHHQQQQQQQQHAHHTAHGTLGTTGTIDNPNPLDFRPNFKLQDVPNLYPADPYLLGAGIAAKGQIESFLNSEHALKDESLVAQLLGDSSPAARPHYHQFLKSQEDEKLEKEALRQQIEYLKAQAAKRPLDLNAGPHRPPIVSNAQKFRPVRRIPSHVRLGVKAPYPLPRIPNYNDRPYSISFKI
ncbi:hypothetical protein ZHAS_00003979 [Anopheles sinensis]|uniref:Uncharacterized protein n=1 Tax=Anopheles sinensis TaxID=74873 RepID=A0A084VFS2_ANOSI|nr:hypothetical protein ZHAS_00003979 [Anopheles sinensis]